MANHQAPKSGDRLVIKGAALRSGDLWVVTVQHPATVTVEVDRLEDVDGAIGKALEEKLGLDNISAIVDINWYRASPRPDL